MLITNATLFTKDFRFTPQSSIHIQADRITAITTNAAGDTSLGSAHEAGDEIVDAHGLLVIPGLVDIHFHGSVGHDFMEGTNEALDAITRYQAQSGITAVCPATMTMSEADITKACTAARDYQTLSDGAELVGINMEGPFISPKKVGAQNPKYVHTPDVEFFRRCQKASGNKIKLLAIAPEEPHALETIAALKNEVLSSIAHTCTSYEIAKQAIAAGATHITHLYNAMPGLAHRDPGPIAAGADASWCEAEIICDGIHIQPGAVRAAFRLFGPERMILISDSVMAVGLSDGKYELGGQDVFVKGRLATLASGTIAGSATNLFDCMKNACLNMELPIETVIRCATYNPARSIKVLADYGTIEPQKKASLIVMDREFNIKGILLRGQWLRKDF